MSAGQPRAGVPSLVTLEGHQASSGRSGASLRAPLTDPPQEIIDVRATEDLGEIPEVEAYANVGSTTSLAIGIGQTTHTKLRSEVDIGRVTQHQ